MLLMTEIIDIRTHLITLWHPEATLTTDSEQILGSFGCRPVICKGIGLKGTPVAQVSIPFIAIPKDIAINLAKICSRQILIQTRNLRSMQLDLESRAIKGGKASSEVLFQASGNCKGRYQHLWRMPRSPLP